jgi:hypothetical protein
LLAAGIAREFAGPAADLLTVPAAAAGAAAKRDQIAGKAGEPGGLARDPAPVVALVMQTRAPSGS